MPYSRHTFTLLTVFIVLSFACVSGITADEKHTTLSGRVLSAEGTPIAGASIVFGLSKVQTDSEGRFIFTKVTENQTNLRVIHDPRSDPSQPRHTRVRAVKFGSLTFYPQHLHDSSRSFTFAITPGRNIENVEVIMEYQMILRGTVVFKNGEPLAGANLKIKIDRLALDGTGGRGFTRSLRTDADGNFISAMDAPGIYMLSVEHRGVSAASEPFVMEVGNQPHAGVLLTLNGNATDLSVPPPEVSKEQQRYHRSFISDVPGTWIINPANGHAYKWIACEDREDAQAQAANEGAHLVTITGAAEQIWLEAVFRTGPYWIGLSDAVKEGQWQWETGEPFFYTNWKPEDEHDRFRITDEPPAILRFLGVKGEDRRRVEEERDYVIMSDWRWDAPVGKWEPVDHSKAARMAILEKDGM